MVQTNEVILAKNINGPNKQGYVSPKTKLSKLVIDNTSTIPYNQENKN